jgi:two-component system, chemotaxis family, protein-glutamate methylesterase/glutaminase
MAGHDLIVIGTSAGGVETLKVLVSQLPADLPAAICVVQHTSPDSPGFLADILNGKGPLHAVLATDGQAIEPGHIYVAPPDRHLVVKPGHLHLSRGPQENRSRPAIDVLFRSAAIAYGSRVIGVLLTGMLNDGVVGLVAIDRCGGLLVVQEPADAIYPELPANALRVVKADHVLPVAQMAALLVGLVNQPAANGSTPPPDIVAEARFAERQMRFNEDKMELGEPVSISCPSCDGPMQEMHTDGIHRYRCHVGHAFTAESLLVGQGEAVERALWSALRMMEERALMLSKMADEERAGGRMIAAGRFEERTAEMRQHVHHLRELVQGVIALS